MLLHTSEGGVKSTQVKTFFSSPPFPPPLFSPLPPLSLLLSFPGPGAHGKGISQKVVSGTGLKSGFRYDFLETYLPWSLPGGGGHATFDRIDLAQTPSQRYVEP
jgi:hypothetical protein